MAKIRVVRNNRKRWFRILLGFLRIFFRRRKYVFLGEEPKETCIIFSNHVGASAPVFHELYAPIKMRFWGTHEMTGTFKENYRYLSRIYLPLKKGFRPFISKILAGIITPFVRIFYRGMKLIPTYTDYRFLYTIDETLKTLNEGESIIIYPEDSHDGYHKHLNKYFGGGFLAASRYCENFNCDIKLYNCYYVKKTRTFVIDKGVPFSQLREEFGRDYKGMAQKFCDRANELGEQFSEKKSKKRKS
ncbi:MAG: hypothetical protein MJZ37_03040 [Bacilli bacterium]|nr:hypothetical protein [Bacilli bacterium]